MVFYCFVPPPLEGLPSLLPRSFLVLYWDCNLQIEPSQNKESVMLPLRILLSPWRARRPTTGRGMSRLSSFFLTAVALGTMFSLGRPPVVFGRNALGDAFYDGSKWVEKLVDPAPSVGRYAALVLDDANRPQISYYDASNGDLKYARWD